jgi:hypothetical protein
MSNKSTTKGAKGKEKRKNYSGTRIKQKIKLNYQKNNLSYFSKLLHNA